MSLLTAALVSFSFVPSTPTQDPPSAVAWRLRLLSADPPQVEIECEFQGDQDGTSALELKADWGGNEDIGADVAELSARGAGGRELTVARPLPSRFELAHAGGERIVARYRLVPLDRGPDPDQRAHYLPILRAGLFHAIGNALLLRPEHLDANLVRPLEFAWSGFEEAGWKPVCSFGLGSGPHRVERDLATGVHALFLAADARVRLLTLDAPGGKLALWIQGQRWPFEDQAFGELAKSVVSCGRDFFQDRDWPFYLISLLETGDPERGSHSLGGTGLTQSFALFMNAGMPLEGPSGSGFGVANLLMHEHFHNWNGMVLRLAAPEQRLYWLSEGFTNFFTRRLMLRGGFTTPEEYAADLSRVWRAYRTNPYRNEPAERVERDFWKVREVGELPYQRGDLLAAWLDGAIRAHSQGARGLDEFMRQLVEQARRGPAEITLQGFLERAQQWAGEQAAELVRRVAVDGADVPWRLDQFEPCLNGVEIDAAAFDLGFDLERSRAEKVICGVRSGSAAEQAGLKDGLKLAGLSLAFGDSDREVEITLAPEGAAADPCVVRYFPRGNSARAPCFTRVPGAAAGDCARL
jgi:predicted metalloprotease with PDZ domain